MTNARREQRQRLRNVRTELEELRAELRGEGVDPAVLSITESLSEINWLYWYLENLPEEAR